MTVDLYQPCAQCRQHLIGAAVPERRVSPKHHVISADNVRPVIAIVIDFAVTNVDALRLTATRLRHNYSAS